MKKSDFHKAVVAHTGHRVRVVISDRNENRKWRIVYVGEFDVTPLNLIAKGTKVSQCIVKHIEHFFNQPDDDVKFEIYPISTESDIDYGEIS